MTLDMNRPRTFEDMEALTEWAWENFKRLEQEFNFGRDAFYLKLLAVEPPKPRDGMIVYADGVEWNPGGGRGIYYYNGASPAWVKLG